MSPFVHAHLDVTVVAMPPPADPSEFAVAVAVDYSHVLDKVLHFLQRTSLALKPVLTVLFALPVLASYLVIAIVTFAVRVAAGKDAHIVLADGGRDAALVEQTAAPLL